MHKVVIRKKEYWTNQPKGWIKYHEGFGSPAWCQYSEWLEENARASYSYYEEWTDGILDPLFSSSELMTYATTQTFGIEFDSADDAMLFKLTCVNKVKHE